MTDGTSPAGDYRLSRRKVLLGLGMAAASGTALARMPVPNREPIERSLFESLIPDDVGPWRFASRDGVVLPPPDALSDRLYDNLVTRVYNSRTDRPVMFLLAYNNRQDGVLQIHRPEICYPVGGFTLSPIQDVDVPLDADQTLPAQAFVARGYDRDETVLYWTRVGTEFPRRWSQQRLSVVRANIDGIIPDGLMMRVSTLGNDLQTELPILRRFVDEFAEAAPASLQSILFGLKPA